MTVIIVKLPPNYRFDHFNLSVKIKSDEEEIARQTEILTESTDTLEASVTENQPKSA